MKGFYIFEESINQLQKEASVACFKLGDIAHIFNTKLKPNAMVSAEVEITALVENTITKATTNEDDTYDFETGALIALMKMCGLEKVVRAFNEVFPKETYNTYITKYERELNELKKEYDKVKDLKEYYKKNYEDVKEHYDKLGDRNKYLIEDINKKLEYIKEKDEEIKRLKASNSEKRFLNGKLLKDYNTAQNTYEVMAAKSADLMDKVKKLEEENKELKKNVDDIFEDNKYWKSEGGRLSFEKHRLEEKVEKIQHDYNLCLNSENALKYTVDSLIKSVAKLNKAIEGYKNDLYNTAKRCKALEAENEKLKLDCEKLQHGYNDMMFCGGRQNGKQYTLLVDLFKKTDQKKVDAAYKEAYGSRVIWCSSQPSIKDTVDELIKQSREFTQNCVDEWLNKPLTKREEMWGKILGDYKIGEGISIKVEKAFINDFLSEAEDNGLVWAYGGEKPTEWDKWESWRRHDYIVFSLFSVVNPKELTWNTTLKENTINYLPPMCWDLFKKGRLAVKVNYNNYKEFYEACENVLGKRPVTAVFTEDFTVSICKKDGLFEIFTIEDQKKTGRKIVDWEDVR